MIILSKLKVGENVFWTDPTVAYNDEYGSSGVYTIREIFAHEDHTDDDTDIMVFLTNTAGSELEAWNCELAEVDLAEHDLFECVDCKAVNDIEDSHGEHKTGLRCDKCNELTQVK
jgi:hypothetical protein